MTIEEGRGSASTPPHLGRARLWWEIAIVLALSVGASAVWSMLSLVRRLIAAAQAGGPALGDQSTSLNPPAADEVVWDVLSRVLSFGFGLAAVALVVYLMWEPGRSSLRAIGLDLTRVWSDLGRGLGLAAVIGLPGLGLYAAGRMLGLTVAVQASPLDAAWWTIPLLVLRAVGAALTEEVIVVAYLFDRLRRLGWSPWLIVVSAAVLRGLYHSYQGFGPIVGNLMMGLVFGWCYLRWRRVMPLVVAHTLLDVVAFVGYPLAAAWWPAVFA